MITYLALAHTLPEHITCIHGWVGWVGWLGWDDHVPCTTKLLLQYYSGTTPYYKVLIRSSATPVLQILALVPLRYYSVLQSTTPVLLCTTKYYSSTTPVLQSNTPVPPRYYSVLQSTTPVQYYSSTTLVPLQYYSVLQSTTPLLLRYYKVTLQYHSGTTPYYKVPLQYSPVRLRYYKALFGGTLYYKVPLQYYKVLLRYSVLQSTTPLLLCTTKYYSSTTTPVLPSQMLHLPQKLSLQHHQTMRLPRKSDTPT